MILSAQYFLLTGSFTLLIFLDTGHRQYVLCRIGFSDFIATTSIINLNFYVRNFSEALPVVMFVA